MTKKIKATTSSVPSMPPIYIEILRVSDLTA